MRALRALWGPDPTLLSGESMLMIWRDGRSPELGSPRRVRMVRAQPPESKDMHHMVRMAFFERREMDRSRRQFQAQVQAVEMIRPIGIVRMSREQVEAMFPQRGTMPMPPPIDVAVRNPDGSINQMFSGPLK